MIAGGHSWAAIQGYTLGQMMVFLKEGVEIERQRWRRDAMTMRKAQHAEADDFKSFLDS